MNFKPFTPKDKRLLKVCDIVRKGLGLDSVRGEYEVCVKGCKADDQTADCCFKAEGWQFIIRFHKPFFEQESLQSQLETIVHEHIHAALAPVSQAALNSFDRHLTKPIKKRCLELWDAADEITIDHLSRPLLNLMLPEIKKVL